MFITFWPGKLKACLRNMPPFCKPVRKTLQHLSVTTDNAQNMVNAIKEAAALGPQIGCFAHIFLLAAKQAVALQQIRRLSSNIRKVVKFFHNSTTAAQAL